MNCMVVDDSSGCRKLLASILQKAGHDTFEFSSGEECLQSLSDKQFHPDVIFLDIYLGGINGIETTKKILELDSCCDIPIVICSADGKRGTILQALKSGAFTYLIKPCSKADVLEALKEIHDSCA